MSSKYQEKEVNLSNLTVVTADKVWDFSKKRKGKPTLSRKFDYFGRVEKGTSAFVTRTNSIGENHKFVKNTSKLPNKVQNEIVNQFNNKNKKVVYLVKPPKVKQLKNNK